MTASSDDPERLSSPRSCEQHRHLLRVLAGRSLAPSVVALLGTVVGARLSAAHPAPPASWPTAARADRGGDPRRGRRRRGSEVLVPPARPAAPELAASPRRPAASVVRVLLHLHRREDRGLGTRRRRARHGRASRPVRLARSTHHRPGRRAGPSPAHDEGGDRRTAAPGPLRGAAAERQARLRPTARPARCRRRAETRRVRRSPGPGPPRHRTATARAAPQAQPAAETRGRHAPDQPRTMASAALDELAPRHRERPSPARPAPRPGRRRRAARGGRQDHRIAVGVRDPLRRREHPSTTRHAQPHRGGCAASQARSPRRSASTPSGTGGLASASPARSRRWLADTSAAATC